MSSERDGQFKILVSCSMEVPALQRLGKRGGQVLDNIGREEEGRVGERGG